MTDAALQSDEPRVELDLGAHRILPLVINGTLVTWHFAPISARLWRKYFLGIRHEVEQQGDRRAQSFDADGALIDLVRNAVEKVEGYGPPPAKGWRAALPFSHCLAIGRVLRSVSLSEPASDAPPALSDLIEISLDAPWTMGDTGHITVFKGLMHRFRQPTIDQVKKFNLEISRTIVTGNSEFQVTTYPSRHAIAMKLYDELIVEVDGYANKGQSLTEAEPKGIAEVMDGAHKATAVLQLFAGGSERISLGLPDEPVAEED